MIQALLFPSIEAKNSQMAVQFISNIEQLYQKVSVVKPLLDFMLTQVKKGLLRVKLESGVYREEGVCHTLETTHWEGEKRWLRYDHQLVIRNNTPSVILHEIAHTAEKSTGIVLKKAFYAAIQEDAAGDTVRYSVLYHKVKSLLIEEVKAYPLEKRLSELFARYFELFGTVRAIEKNSIVDYEMIERFFSRVTAWREQTLWAQLRPLTEEAIIRQTTPHLTSPKHRPGFAVNTPKNWRKTHKSLFDFKED